MSKKIIHGFRTNMTLYSLCLVVFVAVTVPFEPLLAAAEGLVAILVILVGRRRTKMAQASVRQYMDRVSGGMDSARSSNMLYAPLPMLVFDVTTGEILWCNDMFMQLTAQKEKVFETAVDAVIPDFSSRWLMEGKREYPELLHWNDRIYRVFGALSRPEPDGGEQPTLATTYWMDVTEPEQMRQTLELTRPLLAILMVDNYEELMKVCPENKRSALLAALEEQMNTWAADTGGLLLSYDRDRYLFLFEEKDYTGFTESKFDVLEKVRHVQAGEGVSATLSIGVGRDGDSFEQLFKNASLALEMALSRGGDQAVVKDRVNFEFYGGRSKSTEKRTKVKSRVMANALGELIDDAKQVYVMGHKYADMDSLGAAVGVCCIARKRGKPCQIVIDTENNAAHPILRRLGEQPEYANCTISGGDAFIKCQPGALLVVVDTNRPESVESEEMLETCNRVAVIDHHRRGSSYIEKMALNYHEPYASSASELVTELAFGSYNKLFAPNRTKVDWLSADEENVDAYIADPMCGADATVGLFRQMLHGIRFNQRMSHLRRMDREVPVLFVSGDKDPVGGCGKGVVQTYEAFKAAGMRDCTLKLYPELRHEILNERAYAGEITEDIASWLLRKAAR